MLLNVTCRLVTQILAFLIGKKTNHKYRNILISVLMQRTIIVSAILDRQFMRGAFFKHLLLTPSSHLGYTYTSNQKLIPNCFFLRIKKWHVPFSVFKISTSANNVCWLGWLAAFFNMVKAALFLSFLSSCSWQLLPCLSRSWKKCLF